MAVLAGLPPFSTNKLQLRCSVHHVLGPSASVGCRSSSVQGSDPCCRDVHHPLETRLRERLLASSTEISQCERHHLSHLAHPCTTPY